jgi:hypothetical protein
MQISSYITTAEQDLLIQLPLQTKALGKGRISLSEVDNRKDLDSSKCRIVMIGGPVVAQDGGRLRS